MCLLKFTQNGHKIPIELFMNALIEIHVNFHKKEHTNNKIHIELFMNALIEIYFKFSLIKS